MAKKLTTRFVCSSCGHPESRWLGRCPQCSTWNSMVEESVTRTQALSRSTPSHRQGMGHSLPLSSVETMSDLRLDSGMSEVNQVLGGGLIRGSSILLGGEPGIGKSTLLLQIASSLKSPGRVLYISGEESASQIKLRADRLGIKGDNLEILVETNTQTIQTVLDKIKPVLIIIDSIQTLFSPDAGDIPGTVNQLKYGCHEVVSWAKEHETALFLIAHITKGGQIAGPKMIEHMVDTVLHFEQAAGDIRVLRAAKNRFGSVDEIGLFTMDEGGLKEVKDPSSLFLVQREGDLPAGIAVAPVFEGSRAFLVEIQALTVPAKGGMSRVFSERIDSARVSRVCAVLEKHAGLRFADQDVYVNVAGGLKIGEVGVELALALALYSARTGLAIPPSLAVAGELSLAGEIRPVPHLRRRIKAALDLGFDRFVGPRPGSQDEPVSPKGYTAAALISKAVEAVFKGSES